MFCSLLPWSLRWWILPLSTWRQMSCHVLSNLPSASVHWHTSLLWPTCLAFPSWTWAMQELLPSPHCTAIPMQLVKTRPCCASGQAPWSLLLDPLLEFLDSHSHGVVDYCNVQCPFLSLFLCHQLCVAQVFCREEHETVADDGSVLASSRPSSGVHHQTLVCVFPHSSFVLALWLAHTVILPLCLVLLWLVRPNIPLYLWVASLQWVIIAPLVIVVVGVVIFQWVWEDKWVWLLVCGMVAIDMIMLLLSSLLLI